MIVQLVQWVAAPPEGVGRSVAEPVEAVRGVAALLLALV